MAGDRHDAGRRGTGPGDAPGASGGEAAAGHPATDIADSLRARAAAEEFPSLRFCLDLARAHEKAGDHSGALRWALAATDAGNDLAGWAAAAGVAGRCLPAVAALPRTARVAVLGSYTTSQYAALLPVAAARAGVAVEVYECGYGQYRQEVLDETSGLYRFSPDVVVLAVHSGATQLPATSGDPAGDVAAEVARWTALWDVLAARTGATVVQHTFAIPPEVALGHLAARLPGSRASMLAAVNTELGRAAGNGNRVSLLDCERLASYVGKQHWFDARYWHRAKQAVALNCVPVLARHTAAVIGAQLGVGRKCLVLDLDNTLWGGVLGEEGIGGIALGDGPAGEAFTAFQEYVLELKAKGVVLAVCSKNNEADVVEVFEKHPEMRIKLDDIAVFSASWDDKPAQIRRIAATLGIGLDSMVFVDDNPAEREAVRQLVGEVDVIPLPREAHGYVRALADYPFFETAALTAEDAARTGQYRGRAQAARLARTASSLEEYHRSLAMVAAVVPLDALTLPRVAQLVGKTNQFNLTGRRRSEAELAELAAREDTAVLCVRLADRFTDHGLVAVAIAVEHGGVLAVDTWLMSCRVIGRTLEDEIGALLVTEARRRGCTHIRGEYFPTAKNALVSGLYARLGYSPAGPGDTGPGEADAGASAGITYWVLALDAAPHPPGFIQVIRKDEELEGTTNR